jgi:hypothetical protein
VTKTSDSYGAKTQQGSARRLTIAAGVLAAGVLIAVFAWPRLIVGASEGPLEETLHSLSSPNPPSEAAVKRMLALKEQSVDAHGNAKTWADIGLLQLREALLEGPLTADGKTALEQSIAAHVASLTFDPRNAYVWTRLGQDYLVRDGAAAEKLGVILETAVRFAPYDSRLVVARIDMALAAWDQLDGPIHAIMNSQIHIAASQSPTALANLVRERFALNRVTDLLSDDPALLKRFVYAYAHS